MQNNIMLEIEVRYNFIVRYFSFFSFQIMALCLRSGRSYKRVFHMEPTALSLHFNKKQKTTERKTIAIYLTPPSSSSSSSSSTATTTITKVKAETKQFETKRECTLCHEKETEENKLQWCGNCLSFVCKDSCIQPCVRCTNNHCGACMLPCDMANCSHWMCRDCYHDDIHQCANRETCNSTICCSCIELRKVGHPCASSGCHKYWCDGCSANYSCSHSTCRNEYCDSCMAHSSPMVLTPCKTFQCDGLLCPSCLLVDAFKGQCGPCYQKTIFEPFRENP